MTYREIYDRMRKTAEEAIEERRKGLIRAILGYSMTSVIMGANEVLEAMQETIATGEIDNIIIETTGGIGLNSKEPLLNIIMPDGRQYTYELVTPKKAKAILISHSLYDEDIEEWLLKG